MPLAAAAGKAKAKTVTELLNEADTSIGKLRLAVADLTLVDGKAQILSRSSHYGIGGCGLVGIMVLVPPSGRGRTRWIKPGFYYGDNSSNCGLRY